MTIGNAQSGSARIPFRQQANRLAVFRVRTRLRHLYDRPKTDNPTGPTAWTPKLARLRRDNATLRREVQLWRILTTTEGSVHAAGQMCSAGLGGRKDNQLPKFRVQNTHSCQCMTYWKWVCVFSSRNSRMKTFLGFVKPFFQLPLCKIWLYTLIKCVLLLLLFIILMLDLSLWWHVTRFNLKAIDEGWIGNCAKWCCQGLL